MKVKRNQNAISKITDMKGGIVKGQEGIAKLFENFFKEELGEDKEIDLSEDKLEDIIFHNQVTEQQGDKMIALVIV